MPLSYVWPDLAAEEGADASPVLLVTAPGAMGKSAAAEALAAAIHAPLIDLARVPIGSDSLTGLLTRVLGWEQAPDFVKKLRHGDAALILDSLDEAQLASGQAHFAAFLKNVAELLRGGAAHSQVVIYGRRDTIETASLILAEHSIEARQLSVAPLTYAQSCDLTDLVLDDLHADGARFDTHRVHRLPFSKFRDAVLHDMAQALGATGANAEEAWVEVGDFLGYPPVLLVLARHLAVDNPAALTAKPHSHGGADTRGGLLREVTEEILARESGKVRAQMGPALGLDSDDPRRELLYTREEQIVRVVGRITGQSLTVPLPSALTDEQSAVYQDQIGGFVPDHPFLRGREMENVVFADYVRAYTVLAPALELQGIAGIPVDGQSVGPFFAHFVHAMAPKASEEGPMSGVAVIPERIVDAVIKSFSSGTTLPHSFVYSDQGKGAASLLVSEEAGAPEAGDTKILSHLHFGVEDSSGLLGLTSPVSRGLIVTSGAVSVEAGTDELALGPDLAMFVGELFLEGKRLTVTSSATFRNSPNGGVLIASRGEISHDHDLRLSVHPPEALLVIAKDLWHQWHGYKLSIGDFEREIPAQFSWQVMFGLRRILTVFHASVKDDPSLFAERLDRFTVGNNSVFAASLQALMDLDVIVREATLYRLRLARLSEFGVNYAALRGSDFATVLERLHAEVLKTRPIVELLRETTGEGGR